MVLIVVGSFRSAIADWNDVPTGSMKPTIQEGDRILVNRLAYDLKIPFTSLSLLETGDPQVGDVVVLFSPHDGTRLVKRIVAGPGDRVAMRDNDLRLNGVEVERQETPAGLVERLGDHDHRIRLEARGSPFADFGPVTVPPDNYLVMGDNRDDSLDSRYFGFVPRSALAGRTTRLVWSVDPDRWYIPRLERTLMRLDG